MNIKEEIENIIKQHINEVNNWIDFIDIHLYNDEKNEDLLRSLRKQLKRLDVNIDIFIERSDKLE